MTVAKYKKKKNNGKVNSNASTSKIQLPQHILAFPSKGHEFNHKLNFYPVRKQIFRDFPQIKANLSAPTFDRPEPPSIKKILHLCDKTAVVETMLLLMKVVPHSQQVTTQYLSSLAYSSSKITKKTFTNNKPLLNQQYGNI